jgi:hypothetical protein
MKSPLFLYPNETGDNLINTELDLSMPVKSIKGDASDSIIA